MLSSVKKIKDAMFVVLMGNPFEKRRQMRHIMHNDSPVSTYTRFLSRCGDLEYALFLILCLPLKKVQVDARVKKNNMHASLYCLGAAGKLSAMHFSASNKTFKLEFKLNTGKQKTMLGLL